MKLNPIMTWVAEFTSQELRLITRGLTRKLDEDDFAAADELQTRMMNMKAGAMKSMIDSNAKLLENLG